MPEELVAERPCERLDERNGMSVTASVDAVRAAPANWEASFERPVRTIYGVVVGVTVIGTVIAGPPAMIDSGRWLIALLAVELVSAGYVWFRGFDWRVLGSVLAVLAVVLIGSSTEADRLPESWLWQPWITTCVLLGAVCRVGPTIMLTAVSSVGYLTLQVGAGMPIGPASAEIVAGWQAAILVCLVLRSWRRSAAVGDRSEIAEIDQVRLAARVSAADRAEQQAARTLHDRVLHTLRAACAERSVVPAGEVATMATDAIQAFRARIPDSAGATVDFGGRVRHVAAQSGLDVRVTVDDDGSPPPPGPVCSVVLDALTEALRNVHRHAGVGTASVTVHRGPDRLLVAVHDEGRGFDPAQLPARSRGVADSILGAMDEVGGDVTLRSSPGGGSEVILRWPAGDERPGQGHAQAADLMVEWAHSRRDLLCAVAGPQAVGGVLRSFLGATVPSATVVIGTSLGLTGLLIAALPVWRGAPLHRGLAGIAALLGIVAIMLSGVALNPLSTPSQGLATVEVVAPIAMVIAWRRPFAEALGFGVIVGVLITVVTTHTVPGVPAYLPQILLCPLAAVELGLLRRFVAADSRKVESYYLARRWSARVQADADAFAASEARRMARLRPRVLPVLVALAAGRLTLDSPTTKTTLSLVDAAVRDDLQVGGNLSLRSRALVDAARTAGVVVDLIGPAGREVDVHDGLDRLVETALGTPFRPARVALSLTPGADETFTLALLVRPGMPNAPMVPGASVLRTADFTLIRTVVGGGPQ